MRELISVHLGRCGNKIGVKFWEDICMEHGIDPMGHFTGEVYQLQGIASYFSETPERKFVPRAILLDMDPATLDSCRCSPYGQTFKPDNFIFGRAGAENNWAKGALTEGVSLVNISLEIIRKEAENCDSLTGFKIIHALGGGSGAGIGSILLEKLTDEYTTKILSGHYVFPAPRVSEITVEPYNAVLTMPYIKQFCDLTTCFDNEALYGITQNILKIPTPYFEDLNKLVSNVLSGMSCPMRMPGTRNMSLRKLVAELVPYPETHFFIPGYAPLNSRGVQGYRTLSVDNVIQQILHNETLMTSVRPVEGKCITSSIVMRGHVSEGRVEQIFTAIQRLNPSLFVPWLDCHCSYAVCSMAPPGNKIGATWITNHTCVTSMWTRIYEQYKRLHNRKAFIHWYYGEGMGEKDFHDAEESLQSLIKKYQFLEGLPAEGGCVTEQGTLDDTNCISIPDCPVPPEWELDETKAINTCGLDGLKVTGAEGPVCIDRSLVCKCPKEQNYCDCTDKYNWTYRIEEEPKQEPPPTLGPFC